MSFTISSVHWKPNDNVVITCDRNTDPVTGTEAICSGGTIGGVTVFKYLWTQTEIDQLILGAPGPPNIGDDGIVTLVEYTTTDEDTYKYTFVVDSTYIKPGHSVYLVELRLISETEWEIVGQEEVTLATESYIPASFVTSRPNEINGDPFTYDPTLDWSWEDGVWGDYPLIEVRGGGRYKNNVVVVGELDGDGIIYIS
jgi:hypothetical protein